MPYRRALHSAFSVAENHQKLQVFAHVELRCMEIQAAWLASTPAIETKDQLGWFLYEDSEHADELFRRADELISIVQRERVAPDVTRADAFCNEVGNADHARERLAGLYTVLKPQLIQSYRDHLQATDEVCDAPSARVIKRILREEEKQVQLANDMVDQWPSGNSDMVRVEEWKSHLRGCLEQMGGLLGNTKTDLHLIPFRNPLPLRRFVSEFPARDDRWQFEDSQLPLPFRSELSPLEATRILLSTLANGEYEAAEILARSLVDFPDAPWPLRFRLARQLWDEVRHGEMQVRRLGEIGGALGGVVLRRFTYTHAGFERDLAKRLVALNRVTEGRAVDLNLQRFHFIMEEAGDHQTARFFDYIMADEKQHIENGNWIRVLTGGSREREEELLRFGEQVRQELEAFIVARKDAQAMGVLSHPKGGDPS